MAFNSLTFLIFIALFGLGWMAVKNHRLPRYWFITIMSFVFYGWWDWRFLFLIIMSGTVDFFAGLLMDRLTKPLARKLVLALSIVVNLGTLCIFKYSGFFAANIDAVLGTALKDNIPAFALILPVGISFYTFQSMSYTIDVYRRKLKPTHSYIHFMAFLALFPQLVAGPIIRATDLLWRMEKIPSTTEHQRYTATKLIVLGFAQKLLIADNLANYVDKAFANPAGSAGTLFWWAVMSAFALQIYCDFAGYSNIARGLLKYMSYGIKPNFKFPYFASGFREFWNRWHISLSHWFRDYVYIPLGGNHGSKIRQYRALWATFLLSGFWHGASWTFLAWGALHATYLTIERLTRWPNRIPRFAGIIITFLMATIAWVFFRSTTFPDAQHIIGNMLLPTAANHVDLDVPIGTFAMFLLIELYTKYRPLRHKHTLQVILLALTFAIAILFRGPGHGFIYFQF